MAKRTTVGTGLLWALAATVGLACDQQDAGGPDPATSPATLSTVIQPSASRPEQAATVVQPQAPPIVDPSSDYDRMCQHYCDMLEDTLFFSCLGAGGEAEACRQTIPTSAQCFQLRCETRRVQPSLCFTQCDSLAAFYLPACAVITPANETACASSPADHDRECREGCGPATP